MTDSNFNTYDFLINDENEIMLLLYAQDAPAQKSILELNISDSSATLYRDPNTTLPLKDIPPEYLEALQNSNKLLICELNKTDKDEDSQIVYAYEAEIVF